MIRKTREEGIVEPKENLEKVSYCLEYRGDKQKGQKRLITISSCFFWICSLFDIHFRIPSFSSSSSSIRFDQNHPHLIEKSPFHTNTRSIPTLAIDDVNLNHIPKNPNQTLLATSSKSFSDTTPVSPTKDPQMSELLNPRSPLLSRVL
jgi:hypothetical protein